MNFLNIAVPVIDNYVTNMPINDKNRKKVVYPFLRRPPRPETPQTIIVTETITLVEFSNVGGPFSVPVSKFGIVVTDFQATGNTDHIFVIQNYTLAVTNGISL